MSSRNQDPHTQFIPLNKLTRSSHDTEIDAQQFRRRLVDALQALQAMQDCVGRNPLTLDADIEPIIQALDNGGIYLSFGPFTVSVFKHRVKELSCERR
jgi:hypothetical protein